MSAYCNDILIVASSGDFFSVLRIFIIFENKYFPVLLPVAVQRDLIFFLLLCGAVQTK